MDETNKRRTAALSDLIRGIYPFPKKTLNVLVVTDGSIRIDPSPEVFFSVGRVIDFYRKTNLLPFNVKVDVATRDNNGDSDTLVINDSPEDGTPRYEGFRFDVRKSDGIDPVRQDWLIYDYQVILLFGFNPGTYFVDDQRIKDDCYNPCSSNELRVLTTWMNNDGGLFATGDHGQMGASMCYRIPRVGSMRKWTRASGVPPRWEDEDAAAQFPGGTEAFYRQRLNTVQFTGIEPIPTRKQSDSLPQIIEVAVDRIEFGSRGQIWHPHPILEHPNYASINIMPDHDHEGLCNEVDEIDFGVELDFMPAGPYQSEYPEVAGLRPTPKVIAYGHTTSEYSHEGFPVDSRRFPMISVYDGRDVGVGRVVVDSTWHHWMNGNIERLELPQIDNDPGKLSMGMGKPTGEAWSKVSQYYLNVLTYLAPKSYSDGNLLGHVLVSFFAYPGLEAYQLDSKFRASNGRLLLDYLCSVAVESDVNSFVMNLLHEIQPSLHRYVNDQALVDADKFQGQHSTLISLSWSSIRKYVLAGVIHGVTPLISDISHSRMKQGEKGDIEIDFDELEQGIIQGARKAISELSIRVEEDIKQIEVPFAKYSCA